MQAMSHQFPSSKTTPSSTLGLSSKIYVTHNKPLNHLHYSPPSNVITSKLVINPSLKQKAPIISPTKIPNLKPITNPRQQPPPIPPLRPSNSYPTLNPLQRIASSILDVVENSLILPLEKSQPIPKSVDPKIQLSGNYAPVSESSVHAGLEVLGEIPTGLHGVYVRNGANPLLSPHGAHHLFDGDGMIHAVKIGPGKQASYTCRFTETNRFTQEKKYGKNLFPKPVGELHGKTGLARLGLFYARAAIGLVDSSRGIGVANAGLVYFNGRLLAMSEDDLPYHVKINGEDGELETIERFDFDGQVDCPLIAHPKVDPTTGDFHTLSYDVVRKPHLKYFRFDQNGRKSCEIHVSLPHPTMIHDFAITQNFVIIPDGQVVFKLSEMVRGGSPLKFDPNKVARFGILDKEDVDGSNIKWIDVPDSFCFHFMNAWEETSPDEGKTIVLIGSCVSPPDSIFNEKDDSTTRVELCEIRMDLKTGRSTRRVIVPNLNLEVGQVNKRMLGFKTRYVYMAIAEPWPKCGGIAKVDLETGNVEKFVYGHQRYGGEPCFVPNDNGHQNNNPDDEDEGWILSFVRDEKAERSELVVLRAKDLKQIACVCMPSRVPYGFHGTFVNQTDLIIQSPY